MRTGPLAYVVVAVLAVGLVAVTLTVVASNQVSDRKAEKASLESQVAEAQAAATRVQSFADFASVQQTREQTVSTLAQSRFDWERVLRELAIVIPDDVWITSLNATVSAGCGVRSGHQQRSQQQLERVRRLRQHHRAFARDPGLRRRARGGGQVPRRRPRHRRRHPRDRHELGAARSDERRRRGEHRRARASAATARSAPVGTSSPGSISPWPSTQFSSAPHRSRRRPPPRRRRRRPRLDHDPVDDLGDLRLGDQSQVSDANQQLQQQKDSAAEKTQKGRNAVNTFIPGTGSAPMRRNELTIGLSLAAHCGDRRLLAAPARAEACRRRAASRRTSTSSTPSSTRPNRRWPRASRHDGRSRSTITSSWCSARPFRRMAIRRAFSCSCSSSQTGPASAFSRSTSPTRRAPRRVEHAAPDVIAIPRIRPPRPPRPPPRAPTRPARRLHELDDPHRRADPGGHRGLRRDAADRRVDRPRRTAGHAVRPDVHRRLLPDRRLHEAPQRAGPPAPRGGRRHRSPDDGRRLHARACPEREPGPHARSRP